MNNLNEQEIEVVSGGEGASIPEYPSNPFPSNPLEDPTRPGHYYNR